MKFKPGDVIEMTTEDETVTRLRCRILDIESVKVASGNVKIRLTLNKA
jgi:hypothetical protein